MREVKDFYIDNDKEELFFITEDEYGCYEMIKLFFEDKKMEFILKSFDYNMIRDIFENNKVLLNNNNYKNSNILYKKAIDQEEFLYFNEEKIDVIRGISIVKYELHQDNYIILLGSCLDVCNTIFFIDLLQNSIEYINLKNNILHISTKYNTYIHKYISGVPCIVSEKEEINSYVLMLHGGPNANFEYSYDHLSYKLIKNFFNVIKINYTGSTGYGSDYIEKLKGQCGILDYEDVIKIIEYLSKENKDAKIYLYGDSYGAYLASLFAVESRYCLEKIVVTGVFSDILYMEIFSDSRSIILEYFKSEYLKSLDSVFKNKKICNGITFIHGVLDSTCPIQQVKFLVQKYSKFELVELHKHKHFDPSLKMRIEKSNEILYKILANQ